MRKILKIEGASESEFDYGLAYEIQTLRSGSNRVVASDCAPNLSTLTTMVAGLDAPVVLLYVLHTPRDDHPPGRYQSPDLSVDEALRFIEQFAPYLHSDARFDLWFHSRTTSETIVFERHDLLYCYGSPDRHSQFLERLGYCKGAVVTTAPHVHYYRPEFDDAARRLLEHLPWSMTPLRPEDEQ